MKKAKTLATGAMIAALYVVLTYLSHMMGLAIGPFELRFSEALCILPLFTPAAIPGLFCGCILANWLCGALIWDVVFGSLATLLGALGTYFWRKGRFLPYLPPVFFNTVIIPWILYYAYGFQDNSLPALFVLFLVGEVINVGILGFFLKKALTPFQSRFQ